GPPRAPSDPGSTTTVLPVRHRRISHGERVPLVKMGEPGVRQMAERAADVPKRFLTRPGVVCRSVTSRSHFSHMYVTISRSVSVHLAEHAEGVCTDMRTAPSSFARRTSLAAFV